MILQITPSLKTRFVKRKLLIWGAVIGAQFPMSSMAQPLAGRPVKVDVVSESPAVAVGTKARLRVNLLDSENQPAVAKKDVAIQVEGRLPSGKTETSTLFVRAGQSSGTLEVAAKEPGPLKFFASNRELASGGSVLNVRTRQQPTPVPSAATPGPSPIPSFAPPSHLDRWRDRQRDARTTPLARAPAAMPSPGSISPGPAASPPPAGAWNPVLTFMYVPERKIWADKKDAATVYANLPPDEIAPWDMLIYIISSVGPLEPEPLVISKGQNSGKTRLIYDRPATVSVKFMSSTPWAKEVSGLPLKIAFGPTSLKMRINPPKIGLFESTEVAVQLGDANGNSVSDDEKTEVLLAIESGRGALDKTRLTIEPNDPQVTTQFRPILPGTVRVLAESPNLPAAEAELIVETPILILLLCATGGLIGGLVAFFTDKGAKWPRILIGLVTGFVLYWLFAFGLILIPNFPQILVFNPLSAAVLPVFGGWLGTKVFSIGLQKLGINL